MRLDVPAALASIAGAAIVVAAAHAQPRGLEVECGSYAALAARYAEYRQVGAPLQGVIEHIRHSDRPGLVRSLKERTAARVYLEGHDPDKAALEAYRRCQALLGRMTGEEG